MKEVGEEDVTTRQMMKMMTLMSMFVCRCTVIPGNVVLGFDCTGTYLSCNTKGGVIGNVTGEA